MKLRKAEAEAIMIQGQRAQPPIIDAKMTPRRMLKYLGASVVISNNFLSMR